MHIIDIITFCFSWYFFKWIFRDMHLLLIAKGMSGLKENLVGRSEKK